MQFIEGKMMKILTTKQQYEVMNKVFNKNEIRELICEIDKYLQSADVDLSIRTNVFGIANKFME